MFPEQSSSASHSQEYPKAANYCRQPTSVRQPAAAAVTAKVEEGRLSAAGDVVCSRGAVGDGVDIRKADVVAVEAVGLVYYLETRVVWLDKGDVNALGPELASLSVTDKGGKVARAHRVQGSTVHRQLDQLDRCVIASLDVCPGRKWYLW